MIQPSLAGKMKNSSVRLFKADLLSVKGRSIAVDCASGALWITWKNGETTLTPGRSCEISAKGKVCIYALSDASVHIRRTPQRTHGNPFSFLRPGTGRSLSPEFS